MTALVDFLPASFHERIRQRRARKFQLFVGVLLLVCVVATDLAFQIRIASLRESASIARTQASAAESRHSAMEGLREQTEAVRQNLARWAVALASPSISEVLDDLLVDLPETARLHELQCRVDPWAINRKTWLQIDASSTDLNAFSGYLQSLRESAVLPRLRFQRSDTRAADGSQGFRLASAREREP